MKDIEIMNFMKEKNQKNDREIFHENDKKFEQMDNHDKKIRKIKKLAIYSGSFIVLTTSIVLLKKQIDYLNKPSTIVVNDIMANEGMLLTDDGKKIDARMFDADHKAEMYEYCQKHNLDPATLRAQLIHEYIQDHKEVNEDLIMDQLEDRYPGILNNDLIITIEHENKAK